LCAFLKRTAPGFAAGFIAGVLLTYFAMCHGLGPNAFTLLGFQFRLPGCRISQTSTPTPPVPTPTGTGTPSLSRRSFYPLPTGGELLNLGCLDWTLCRTARDANSRRTSLISGTVGASLNTPREYLIQRVFLFFDTSQIPDDALIQSASLRLCSIGQPIGTPTVHLVQSTASDSFSLEDFDRVGSESGGSITFSLPNQCLDLAFGPTALQWITSSGVTKIAIVHDFDVTNTVPVVQNLVVIALPDDPEYRARLDVTFYVDR